MVFVVKSEHLLPVPDTNYTNGQEMAHPEILRCHVPVKGETTDEEYILEEAFIRVAAENEALVKKLKRRRSEEVVPGFDDSGLRNLNVIHPFRVKNEPFDEEYPAYNNLDVEQPPQSK